MSATRATAVADKGASSLPVTRSGHQSATGHANTWCTFTMCHVNRDGSGYVEVRRGKRGLGGRTNKTDVLHRFDFGSEDGSEREVEGRD